MTARWFETFTGPLDQKKRYKAAKARINALPPTYRSTATAMHRYMLGSATVTDGATLITMFEDFADLWEQAAADGTPIRDIVGENPSEFADTFMQAYSGTHWADKQRRRLADAVDAAEVQERDQ